MERKKGFTIVELLTVIVVLAIVLGLAVVAYIGLGDKIDITYYRNLEESLTISGTDYFYYNKEKAPSIFGEQAQVPLSFLKENNYIEDDVLSSNGEECNLNDSYVGAYKNSLDETKYYVCLKCGNYETDTCSQKIDYTLNVRGQVEDTKENYDLKGDKWVNKNIVLTFETVNDIKEVHVTGNNFSKTCEMNQSGKVRTCKVTVEASGTYNYYGSGTDNDTEIKSVKVLIDKTSPTFDIENIGTNNKIEIETTTLKATINNTIKNILDNESGIKTIEYSLVKEGEKDYYHKVNNATSFNIKQELDIGKYKLRIRVYNNANLVTIKEIDYDIYKSVEVPKGDGNSNGIYCNNLTYNAEKQILTKETEGVIFSNNEGIDAKGYPVNAKLKYGYRWSDNTTSEKTMNCNIAKKAATIEAKEQTYTYGGSLATGVGQIISSGLINPHVVTNITLTPSTTNATTNGTITPSGAVIKNGNVDVTSNYEITYKTGKLVINKATPTLTLSATSGSVNAASTITFKEKSNVKGKFGNVSSLTGVATVSPALTGEVNANTEQTVTITGVSNGQSTITVTFTPSDTTNYNSKTATYTVTGYKVANQGSCANPVYNGTSQNLVTGQIGVDLSNATRTVVGSQEITATLQSGYRFSDNTTSPKKYSCSILKRGLTITAKDQTYTYGGSLASGATQVNASGLVSGHNITSVSLTPSTTNATTNGTITPSGAVVKSGANDVTSNYEITYKTGKLVINKATPTLNLSATSGSVNKGSTITFTENSNVKGKFSNVSSSTGVATVSPGTTGDINANTNQTVTITGASNGQSTITVTFTPSDTTNYNSKTATYTVTGYLLASTGSCQSRTYNGGSQTLMSGGVGVTYTNNERTQAGSQNITINVNSGYRFSDTTTSKTQSCSIAKADPVVTLTPTSGSVDVGKSITFNERANVKGKFGNASSATGTATVSPGTTGDINANTDQAVTVTGNGSGNSNITVTFTPTDTTNYNNKTATYTVKVNAQYCANFYENGATSISGRSACCTITVGNNSCTINAPTITKDGWEILGWGLYENSTNAAYDSGGSITLNGPKDFYAITRKKLNITIVSNAGVADFITTEELYNTETSKTTTIPDYTTSVCRVAPTAYRVYRISNLSGNNTTYCKGDPITLTEDITLSANWAAEAKSVTTGVSCVYGSGGSYSSGTYYYTDETKFQGSGSASGYTCGGGRATNLRRNDPENGKKCTMCCAKKFPAACSKPTAFPSQNSCQLNALACTSPNTPTGENALNLAKTATIGSCNNLVFNDAKQTLASGGENVQYVTNEATEAGSYLVTVNAQDGYNFSDLSTTKTLNCTIEKKELTVNNTNLQTATIAGINGETIKLNTSKKNNFSIATMKDVNPNYSLKNTVLDSKSDNTSTKTTYQVNYYLMNDDKVNYRLVNSNTYETEEGIEVTGLVKEYEGYISPKEITIKIINGENIINYYYKLK